MTPGLVGALEDRAGNVGDFNHNRGERAAITVESALIILLVAIFLLASVSFVGGTIGNLTDQVGDAADGSIDSTTTTTAVSDPGDAGDSSGGGGYSGSGSGDTTTTTCPDEEFTPYCG